MLQTKDTNQMSELKHQTLEKHHQTRSMHECVFIINNSRANLSSFKLKNSRATSVALKFYLYSNSLRFGWHCIATTPLKIRKVLKNSWKAALTPTCNARRLLLLTVRCVDLWVNPVSEEEARPGNLVYVVVVVILSWRELLAALHQQRRNLADVNDRRRRPWLVNNSDDVVLVLSRIVLRIVRLQL